MRALIVDDDKEDVQLISDLLLHQAIERPDILIAHSGADAITVLTNERVDVCLVDHHLGDVKGSDLIRQIGALHGDVPCILITGGSEESIDMQAEISGAFDFISKENLTARLLHRSIRYATTLAKSRTLERQMAMSEISMVEAERARFARDIHDGLGQLIQGLVFMVEAMRPKEHEDSVMVPTAQINILKEYIDLAVKSVSEIAKNLSPVENAFGGLERALTQHCEGLRSIHQISIDDQIDTFAVNSGVAQNLFRICQEASNNALRHGLADKIYIKLFKHNDEVTLIHEDNGQGMSNFEQLNGYGLKNMDYRMRALGGELVIESSDTGGCRIICRVVDVIEGD